MKHQAVAEDVFEALASGKSYTEAGLMFGLNRNQVGSLVRRHGKGTNVEQASRRLKYSPDFRWEVANAEGTQVSVAAKYGISPSTVGDWRKGLGIRGAKPRDSAIEDTDYVWCAHCKGDGMVLVRMTGRRFGPEPMKCTVCGGEGFYKA